MSADKIEHKKQNAAELFKGFCGICSVSFVSQLFLFLAVSCSFFTPANSYADIYKYKDKEGKWHYTNVRNDIRYKFYFKTTDEDPDVFIDKYGSIINQASKKFSLEPSLIKAVIKAESDFDHKALSDKGAQGLMQLMPETANELAVVDPYNPEENIFGGALYLSRLLERYNKNVKHALAAYNAGPVAVDKYKGIPPFKETRNFVKRVLYFQEQYKSGKKQK